VLVVEIQGMPVEVGGLLPSRTPTTSLGNALMLVTLRNKTLLIAVATANILHTLLLACTHIFLYTGVFIDLLLCRHKGRRRGSDDHVVPQSVHTTTTLTRSTLINVHEGLREETRRGQQHATLIANNDSSGLH
jgi:hypothetical protein